MDNFRPELNTGRSVFHVTHVISANAIYELPFGRDKQVAQFERAGRTRIVGGWQVGTIFAWQSGSPISIYSGRGDVQPRRPLELHTIRSAATPRSARCRRVEIKGMLGIFKQPDGKIYWIDPKVVDPTTGRAVGADNLGEHGELRRPGVLQPGGGRASATSRSSPSTVRRSSASTSRCRSASASRTAIASRSRARRST